MFVCAVNGSPNKEGNIDFLISTVLAEVEKNGIDTVKYNMGEVIKTVKTPFCNACKDCTGECYKGSMLENLYEAAVTPDTRPANILVTSPIGAFSSSLPEICEIEAVTDAFFCTP